MQFYDPSEKIKLMRKKLGVNQADLEGPNMTRSFISMMENGKRKVTLDGSKYLLDKFKEIGNKLNIPLNLSEDYFSKSAAEDARCYCQVALKEDMLTHKKLEELLEIQSKYELTDLLADTYLKNGIMYIMEKDYSTAFINLSNSLEKYKDLNDVVNQSSVYLKLGLCNYWKNNYEEAIFFYRKAIEYAKKSDNQLALINASYNLGLTYGRSKAYDECEDILITNIINNDNTNDSYILNSSKIIIGNLYLDTGRYAEAAKEYFDVVDTLGDKDEALLGLLYNNISEYYYKIDDYTNSLHYINEAQRIKTKLNDKKSLPNTFILKAKILFAQGFHEESIMLLELAMDIAENHNNIDVIIDIYKDFMTVLEARNDLDGIKEKMSRLLDTLVKMT